MQEFVPTTTQYPNFLFDLMPSLKEGELRLLNAIVRKTYGWHKQRDKISLSQMIELTGMSKQGVLDARERLINKKIIKAEMVNGITEYMVIVPDDLPVNKVDVNKKEVVQIEQPASLNQSQVDVYNVDTQKKVLQNKNTKEKEEERALEIRIKQNFQDPFIPKHDFDGANLVWKVLTKNSIENYKTAIPSDPTHCSAIFQLLICDDKESELEERLLQYEYSWFGENKKTPNAKNVFKSWDQLTPGKVPYYIREGFKTENECLSARRKKAEEKKEEAKPNIDWQALMKKEEERVKQVLAILGETQEMVNGTN